MRGRSLLLLLLLLFPAPAAAKKKKHPLVHQSLGDGWFLLLPMKARVGLGWVDGVSYRDETGAGLDPRVIEMDEDGVLWSDAQLGGGVRVTIDGVREDVVVGTFEGNVCALIGSALACEPVTEGVFSAVDDRVE